MRAIVFSGLILFAMLDAHAWGDLTGRWSCNDGGTYYLRQTGEQVHWYGEAANVRPAWSNIFSGRVHEGHIKGRWTDVPKGRTAASGDLELVIEKNGHTLRAIHKTEGFKGSRWTRRMADTADSRPLAPINPSGNKDCVGFNPATVSVHQVSGRWKIIDGNRWLFDFGTDPATARNALKVIRHYRMNRFCFIAWPDPSFSYMLAKGGIPSGAMAGEDCVTFAPDALKVTKIKGRWKIVSGRRWLFDFNRSETDARKAIAVIRRYGFTQSCSVGRPDADVAFTYLRR